MTDAPDPNVQLVPVFHIRDGAVVPLATIALEDAGIEYEIRAKNTLIPGVGKGGSGDHTGYDVDVPGDIFVRAGDAARARDLLGDLTQAAPPAAGDPTPAEWAERAEPPADPPEHADPSDAE